MYIPIWNMGIYIYIYVYTYIHISLALFPFNQEEHHTSYFILQVAIFTQ